MGHGNSGWAPYTFFFREGQNVDVGVVKLFLSRKQVNLSDVAQSSPFASVSEPVGGHSTPPPSPPSAPSRGPSSTTTPLPLDASLASRALRSRVLTRETSDPKTWRFPWDTVEIIVVQQRENV